MRRRAMGRWVTSVRLMGVAALVWSGLGLAGCVRHQSQMDSLRADRREIAPQQGRAMLAEVVE